MPPRRRSILALAAVLLIIAPAAAVAYDWQNGDVFVGLSTGQYNVYDNAGTLHETINQTTTGTNQFAVDCAFDRAGVLHTTAFAQDKIVRFLSPAPHTILPPDLPSPTSPESVSFARDGTFWVGHQANPGSLAHFDSGGNPITTFTPSAPASMVDLSADQRTMFYTDRSLAAQPVIHRFDVVSGTNLPDFANLASGTRTIADFKLLPPGDGTGGAIVADGTTIKRVNGAGQVVQTYDFPGRDSWFGIALDPDGKSFWAQNPTPNPTVVRFNIASGAVDRGPLPSAANAFGICVRGTRTAAIDNAPPTIAITRPGDGESFRVGERATASYSCTDDRFGTGVASCSGPVPSGGRIDTASAGTKTFKVDATDVAGNTATLTHTYVVSRTRRVGLSVVFKGRSQPHGALLLTSLKITRLTRGARVELRCKGGKKKGCPFKRKKVSRPKGRNLSKLLKRHALKQKAVLEFRATKRHFIGAVADLRISKGNATLKFLCLPPGKKTPRRRCG
jgi:sugar lactone lactonase YvrE